MTFFDRLFPAASRALDRLAHAVLHLVARPRMDRDMADEIESHLNEKIEALVESGMNRRDATDAARRAFGNVTLTIERGHDVWGWSRIETWWADLGYACRQLRRSASFTLVAVASSALGIGAATAAFSVLYAVLLNPYPYRDAEQLVHLHVVDKGAFLFDLPLSHGQFSEFEQSPVLLSAMAMDVEGMAATGTALPEPVSAGLLSPNAFEFLGVPPLLGRVFTARDTRPLEVVLSHAYWQLHFNGRPDIVGQLIPLDYQNYTVIGVMPPRFAWWDCDIYLPLKPSTDPDRLATVFARLKPGTSDADAEQQLQSLVGALATQRPGRLPATFQIQLLHMTDIASGQMSGTLALVGAAAGLLLVIGCANVSILLLARGAVRTQELAVRVAVGASRGRLLRQLLTESMLISAIGGAAGVLLAYWAVALVSALVPRGTFPSEAVIGVNTTVLLFSVLVVLVTGVAAGLWPALQSSHPEFHRTKTVGRRQTADPQRRGRAHNLLITGQVALTLVLLAGAGATARLFNTLVNTTLDYDPRALTSVRVDLRDGTYTHWEDRIRYLDRITEAVALRPGISAVALSLNEIPPVTGFRSSTVELRARADPDWQPTLLSQVSADYFSTLRIPVMQGRPWTRAETQQAARVAVVNATMAARLWPSSSPLEQLIHLPDLKPSTTWTLAAPENDGWVRVIGVVGDTPATGLKEPTSPTVYVPYSLVAGDSFRVIVRADGSSTTTDTDDEIGSAAVEGVARVVADAIQTIDPDQPVGQARSATSLLAAEGWARERLTASLFSAFALLAVLLSATGLYSVAAYIVSQRSAEFGIRMALGARGIDILRLVLGYAINPMLAGVTAGLALCIVFNGLLVRWTSASVRDPLVVGPVVMLLVAATVIAALVPAVRAATTNPMNVLRGD